MPDAARWPGQPRSARCAGTSGRFAAWALAALLTGLLVGLLALRPAAAARPELVVGSKRFTESYILAELVRQTLAAQGLAAVHQPGLGNTGILAQALASGAVDIYPEYTGTIARELLQRDVAAGKAAGMAANVGANVAADGARAGPGAAQPALATLNQWLAPRGLKVAVPLGFNNSYALAMRESVAQRLGVQRISDLARLPAAAALKLGLSHEFLQRADGWPALQRAYGLPQAAGAALDHGLVYEALQAGQIDLIDVYSTDAKIGRYGLRVLVDDRQYFPRYDAVLLMRASVDAAPLQRLAGRLDEATMVKLNGQAELDGLPFAEVARRFLATAPGAAARAASLPTPASPATPAVANAGQASAGSTSAPVAGVGAGGRATPWQRLWAPDLARLLGQHLALVAGALALAVASGVPLGVLAWRRPRLAGLLLGAVGLLQTIPSLALLAVLIALLGQIGFAPALLALWLYALLPIVHNTYTGLAGVPAGLQQAALALGLSPWQTLRLVQLPLALPTLLAGISTAAVISVGTATVAAFVGAGGLGERIVAGLAVNDSGLMLAGALPAAALALGVQGLFGLLGRRLRGARPSR